MYVIALSSCKPEHENVEQVERMKSVETKTKTKKSK